MEIETKEANCFSLNSPPDEKTALLKAIKLCIVELGWELSVRTGFTNNEYNDLANKLQLTNSAIFLTEGELKMISQAFNETYNGFFTSKAEGAGGLKRDDGN